MRRCADELRRAQAVAAELQADNRQLSAALQEREQQALALAQKQRELRQQLHDARRAAAAQGLDPELSGDDVGGWWLLPHAPGPEQQEAGGTQAAGPPGLSAGSLS